jgi:prephenate dehydrogenase
MLLAEAIANEPETVADIQIMNREFPILLRELQAEIQSLARMVNKRERARLVARYRQLREALSADPEFRVARKMFETVSEAYSVVSTN